MLPFIGFPQISLAEIRLPTGSKHRQRNHLTTMIDNASRHQLGNSVALAASSS